MRNFLIPVVAVGLAMSLPAWAQSQQSGTQSAKPSQSGSTQTGSTASAKAGGAERLKQSLEKAGWKNVRVVDAAYLIHAQTPDGDAVVMTIDPPGGPLSGSKTNASGSTGAASGGSAGSGASTEKPGSSSSGSGTKN